MSVDTAILPPPRNRRHVTSYARAVGAGLRAHPFLRLAVRLPIYDPLELAGRVAAAASTPRRSSTRVLSVSPTALITGGVAAAAAAAAAMKPLGSTGLPLGSAGSSSSPRLVIPPQDTPAQQDAIDFLRELNATWEMWDVIRTICDYDQRLSLGVAFLFFSSSSSL